LATVVNGSSRRRRGLVRSSPGYKFTQAARASADHLWKHR